MCILELSLYTFQNTGLKAYQFYKYGLKDDLSHFFVCEAADVPGPYQLLKIKEIVPFPKCLGIEKRHRYEFTQEIVNANVYG